MGGCQSTPAGDGQAISTNSSNNTSRGAAPASKYVEGTGQGQSQVDRQSKLDEGNDTYITALPGNPSAASSRGTPAPAATADPASKVAAASSSNGAGAASSLAGVSTVIKLQMLHPPPPPTPFPLRVQISSSSLHCGLQGQLSYCIPPTGDPP